MARRELSDDEWELIDPFLPIGRYRPYPAHLREQFEGVIWRFRTGSQWREMPPDFGVWQTVYDRFAQWRATQGSSRKKEQAAAGDNDTGRAERRHIMRRRRARLKAAALGRSRGGLTCKVHVAADRRCRPLALR